MTVHEQKRWQFTMYVWCVKLSVRMITDHVGIEKKRLCPPLLPRIWLEVVFTQICIKLPEIAKESYFMDNDDLAFEWHRNAFLASVRTFYWENTTFKEHSHGVVAVFKGLRYIIWRTFRKSTSRIPSKRRKPIGRSVSMPKGPILKNFRCFNRYVQYMFPRI